MIKITTNNKDINSLPEKYCRLILTENPISSHRFVETQGQSLEYRMGAGKFNKINARNFRTLVRSIVQAVKLHEIEYLAIDYSAFIFPKLSNLGEEWLASTLVENLLLAKQRRYPCW